jgi:hypothetical protein
MCANTLRGFVHPLPERGKGELSLEFCSYKDTFGPGTRLLKNASPSVPDCQRDGNVPDSSLENMGKIGFSGSNHDICRFVMDGFFYRFFLFWLFRLDRFVNMILSLLGLRRETIENLPGDPEVLSDEG